MMVRYTKQHALLGPCLHLTLVHSSDSQDLGTKQTLRSLNSFIAPFTGPYQLLPITEIQLDPNKSIGLAAVPALTKFGLRNLIRQSRMGYMFVG
jgi:hypothetical protein